MTKGLVSGKQTSVETLRRERTVGSGDLHGWSRHAGDDGPEGRIRRRQRGEGPLTLWGERTAERHVRRPVGKAHPVGRDEWVGDGGGQQLAFRAGEEQGI